jgi:hypothetical protein
MSRLFDPVEYPHGCRCACCGELFEAGDAIVDREVADNWSTPTCERCACSDQPLVADHPFNGNRTPILCADGRVR